MTVEGNTCAITNTPGTVCYDVCFGTPSPSICPTHQPRAFYQIDLPPMSRREFIITPRMRLLLLDDCALRPFSACIGGEFAPSNTYPDLTYTYPLYNNRPEARHFWVSFQGGEICGPYHVTMREAPAQ